MSRQNRRCMACGELFQPFIGKERVCGPRCAGDLARREHADLRLDTYRKEKVVERPISIVHPDVANALADTRANVANIREAVDLLNGKFCLGRAR